jgi:long-chain acyl-CoA synthetase
VTAAAGASGAVQSATLSEALRYWARATPTRHALSASDEELDYAELDRAVDDAARRLRGMGVEPGDRFGLLGRNSLQWVIAFLAGLRIGAIVVPLNVRLGRLELRRQLETCQPRAILADEALLPRVAGAGAVPVHALDSLGRLRSATGDDPHVPSSAPALISFTSGTTGLPKGAVISHGALVRSASSFVPHLETSSADSTLVAVPLFHNTGFADQLAQMLLVGGAVDLLAEFHTQTAIEALARRPASYLIAVPSIFRLLMLHNRADQAFRDCRVAVYGGASMPATWIEELAERFPELRLFNCYGLTEFTSVSHLLDPEYAAARGNSVGRPVEGVAQRIADDGEIWLSGPTRMTGYWQAPEETRRVLFGEWLRTGDLGRIDDGFLTVLGRSADVINRGGEKIHAVSVEAVLSGLPTIVEAAVVGAPHPILQECVVAFVVPRVGFDEGVARRHLADRVADYAVPERFVVANELPRNAAGKVDRAQLRAEAALVSHGGGG